MVTVAKNVEAPIKCKISFYYHLLLLLRTIFTHTLTIVVMFPQDLLEKGLAANNCAMLGLGDIVIPGIFIALLLRYDYRYAQTYFGARPGSIVPPPPPRGKGIAKYYFYLARSQLGLPNGIKKWFVKWIVFCSKSGGRSRAYFWASFIAYCLGLMLTIFVMHVFKHAQPALLYLVPACLSAPALVSVVKGELPQLIK